MSSHNASDRILVRYVVEAKPKAWDQFVHRVADAVWTACRLLTRDEPEARETFAAVVEGLRADGFRRLRAYDGSSRLETYVALVARDILAERLLRLFQSGTDGWNAFERFFGADITRIIGRRLPGGEREDLRRDAYQEICIALIADDFRRLKAYRGIGSFTGFVLHMVDRLLIDVIRRTVSGRKMEAATSLPEWEEIPCDRPSPELAIQDREDEHLLSKASEVLRHAAENLSATERLYLQIVLGSGETIPARDVARLMCSPVEEIYKLKQRVMSQLRGALEKHPAVKLWRASV